MNRRKLNISLWCYLGLAAVLVIGCLAAATGSSFARYRSDSAESVWFAAQVPKQIYLGQIRLSDDGVTRVFDAESQGCWEVVDDQTQLIFAVANGTLTSAYAEEDQQVRIRLVGSPGVWDGVNTAQITLLVPQRSDPTKFDEYKATATKIQKQSPMHAQFGDGWVFSFHDVLGDELTWELKGEKFSYYEMRIVLDAAALEDTSMLQLQVIA